MITSTCLSYNEFIRHLAFVQYFKKLKNALYSYRRIHSTLFYIKFKVYLFSRITSFFFCSQSYISRTLYLCVAVPQSLNLSKEKQYINLTNIHFISLCTYTLLKHTRRMFMYTCHTEWMILWTTSAFSARHTNPGDNCLPE